MNQCATSQEGLSMAKVRITGLQLDLLAVLFPRDPRVAKDGDHYYVQAEAIDAAVELGPAGDPVAVAMTLLSRMNIVAQSQMSDVHPAALSTDPDAWVGWAPPKRGAQIRIGQVTLYAGLPAGYTANTAVGDKVLAAAETNDAAALAMFYLSRNGGRPDWFDLYKVYEIIRDHQGGEDWMEEQQPGKIDLFTLSANHASISGFAARHATTKGRPPKTSGLSLADGRSLMTALTVAWIWEKL
jgi:hypothetical protein